MKSLKSTKLIRERQYKYSPENKLKRAEVYENESVRFSRITWMGDSDAEKNYRECLGELRIMLFP